MPEAAQKPDDQQVQDRAGASFAVSSERDIHIFPKPGAECDMPSAPEVRDASCHIRMAEVCRHMEAEHLTQTDSHQGVPAEVKIKLHGVGKGAEPCKRGGDTLVTDRTDFVPQSADAVCDDDLVSESYDKGLEAVVKSVYGDRPFFNASRISE